MPKPHGTYLRVQRQERTRLAALEAKKTVSVSRQQDLTEFYKALDKVAEDDLDGWHRSMSALAVEISKNGALSKEDKIRKKVSKVLGEVRKLLEKFQNYKQLEGTMRVPVDSVMRPPLDLGPVGAELALVVALVKVLEFLVLIRKRK